MTDSTWVETSPDIVFGQPILRKIGPVFQGYIDSTCSTFSTNVVEIARHDRQTLLRELATSGDEKGWKNGGVTPQSALVYGYREKGRILSVASSKTVDAQVASVRIYTHPSHRERGLSRETLSALTHDLLSRDYLVLYQTLMANTAAIKTAISLGFNQYAEHTAYRFAKI